MLKFRKLRNLKNNDGFGLLEAIFGGLLIAAAAVLITKGIFRHRDSDKISKTIPRIVKVNDSLINSMKKLFKDTKDTDGNRSKGLCQFINTNSMSPGVGLIKLKVFANNSQSEKFSDEDWQSSFYAWEPAAEDECEGTHHWKKCFKLKDHELFGILPTEKERMNVVGSIEVRPTNMNPLLPDKALYEDFDVSTASMERDVKEVSFRMIAKVYYNEQVAGNPRKTIIQEDFFWAPAVGECDYIISTGDQVILSLSGMGGADPNGKFIYNKSSFVAQDVPPVDVEFIKSQVTNGTINPESQRIVSDTSQNVAVSCNEVKFRCRQGSGNRDFGPMNVDFRLDYNETNNQAIETQVQSMAFFPELEIRKSDAATVVGNGTATRVVFDGVAYNRAGNRYASSANPDRTLRISNTHSMRLTLTDSGNSNSNNTLCQSICTEGNNYNYNAAGEDSQNYLGILKYLADGQEYRANSLERMECIACYMKDCGRLGLSTFGPMHRQPSQPLDAGVPECNANLTGASARTLAPYEPITSSNGNGCVAARLDDTQDKLILEERDCSSNLPVMCFNFGTFFLARDLNTNNSDDLSLKSFNDSFRRCYETGRERANKATLDSYVVGGPMTAPTSGANYDFINIAQQGMFIAPQTTDDLRLYRKWLNDNSIANQEVWVALNSNYGHFKAAPPEMKNENNEVHALYFNQGNRLQYKKFQGGGQPFNPGGASKAMLLLHNIRYKGVVEANKNQGSKSFHFLCLDLGGEFFKSDTASSNWNDGIANCLASGGLFVPPVTAIHWAQALKLAAPFDERYAFPDPNSDEVGGVWIAYEGNGPYHLPDMFFDNPAYAKYKFLRDGLGTNKAVKLSDGTGQGAASKALCVENGQIAVINKNNICSNGSRKIEITHLQSSPMLQMMYILWVEAGTTLNKVQLVDIN